MPNVGKPSKGCKNCRDRKVKCDQKRPSCSQCMRIQKECHGYRDPLSMMFRNESDVVAQKAEMRYKELSKGRTKRSNRQKDLENVDPDGSSSSSSSSSSSNEESSPPSTTGSDQQLAAYSKSLLRRQEFPLELVHSLQDLANGFFFSKHVAPPTIALRGQHDYLFDLLGRPNISKILQTSVNAVSLASLANSKKSQMIMRKAQGEYVSALGMTNEALQSRDTAREDSTLAAVLMLGLYESFMYQGKQSLKAWQKHTEGACALIRLRGRPHSSIGIRIFQQFYGTILLVALESQTPVPVGMREIWEAITQVGDYSVAGKEFTTKFVRFLHRAIDSSIHTAEDPVQWVMAAMDLARELQELPQLIPNIWRYETVYIGKPTQYVYGNSYDIYMDPWIAQMWNNLRSVGLHLHTSIRQQLIKGMDQFRSALGAEQFEAQLKASEKSIWENASGICASVPQLIGQLPFPSPPRYKASPDTSCSDLFNARDESFKLHPPDSNFPNRMPSTGMYHLVWPLYSMGISDICPEDLRQWCIEKLLFLARTVGTRQAVTFAEELKEKSKQGSALELVYRQTSSRGDLRCSSSYTPPSDRY
ncbi:hypothetical protein P154DRAFT_440091 [Amniculicola lignicola CBS 123094]|uniref:Zn(2)-C6 fungal-type domain-containing protein n=1 Tax=Amniculicola lignicola CBS 123094 TaxID=1392246 RepID=A0A6A5WB43_9PLEO|nr:hypothetical protein P154DRAFT_440091 [Amniculicola lignicola CBS 123094]